MSADKFLMSDVPLRSFDEIAAEFDRLNAQRNMERFVPFGQPDLAKFMYLAAMATIGWLLTPDERQRQPPSQTISEKYDDYYKVRRRP